MVLDNNTYINGLSACAVMIGKVTTLAHEISDDTVEARSSISETFFAGAESTEVFGRLGHNISTQFHDDTASSAATDGNIEVNFRVGPALFI
jgi:hypothetical protein